MLSAVARNIIIRSLIIRKNRGEAPKDVLRTYVNLTESEKAGILKEVEK